MLAKAQNVELSSFMETEQGTRQEAQDAVQSAKSSTVPVKITSSIISGFNHFKVFKYADQPVIRGLSSSWLVRLVHELLYMSNDDSINTTLLVQQLHGNS